MDNAIIELWNKKVKQNDIVYILGDFSFYKGEETNEILRKLKGRKILIIGNHDHQYLNDLNFDTNLFEKITQYEETIINKKRIIMFHYPIIDWNCKFYNSIHLYGHVHDIDNKDTRYMNEEKNCYNVGFDIWHDLVTLEDLGVKI